MSIGSPVALVGFAFLGFVAGAALVGSLALPAIRRRTANWSPDSRCRALLLLAVAPLLLAAAATLAAFAPSILALGWPDHDHCTSHPGHVHLCLAHPPAGMAHPFTQLGFGLVVAFFVLRGVRFLLELARARRWATALLARAAVDPVLGARVLPTERKFCVILGLVRPSIVLSKGIMCSVTKHELRAILEHERAHAERHDTLWALLVRVSTAFMLPSRRRALLADFALAAEQSSDERAASVVGDRVAMAEVILKVERLVQDSPSRFPVLATSFSGVGVVERVTALLEPIRAQRRMRLAPLLLIGAVVTLFLEAPSFHHLVETLIGVLTG